MVDNNGACSWHPRSGLVAASHCLLATAWISLHYVQMYSQVVS